VSKVGHPFELSSSLGIAGTQKDSGVEKSKIGISKSETNLKFKSSKTANKEKTFEFGTFGFVSNFGLRASNLESALFTGGFDSTSSTTCLLRA
jgi:hypothetical protein